MVVKSCDEKSFFAKYLGQRVPIIFILLIFAILFLKLGSIELAGGSGSVAFMLAKDYVGAVTNEKQI